MLYSVYFVDESGKATVLFGKYDNAVDAANAALLIRGKIEVEINDSET